MKMKTTIIGTVLLAASTLAAPTVDLKRALQSLQIKNLSGNLYTETPPTTNIIAFALNDPNTNIDTDCEAVWSVGQAGTMVFNCSNPAYQVNFPDGIYNIEDFVLRVTRPDGTAGQNTVSGADWECTTSDGYPEESCEWVGVFNIDVTAS
ncbi:hypothetical protein N7520_009204 [Penicillium odoratum]|uniref:uncharacterized protein n=1 Tax=Penicillium odoratum TaxID=1167516 RepID=UPI0025484ED7|nr:uncharacterized protein N7520_009204 [Penicillium odoratum]KAJ5752287.1 hypothetical protein N7520_009204 [Penicillium odoratum]